MQKVVVVANLTVKDEFVSDVYNALIELHNATNKNDKGCISYKLNRDANKKNVFVFIEKWESEETLTLHTKQEHFEKFTHFIDGKTESMSVEKLEEIEL